MKTVVFILGENCSGKTTFAKHFKNPIRKNIEMGQLVREKYETEERVFDSELDEYLFEKTRDIIHTVKKDNFVITGVRQVSLLKKLAKLFDKVEYKYLVVPRDILKERFQKRAAKKDTKITFEEAISGDESLGIKDLQHYLLTEVKCEFINRY